MPEIRLMIGMCLKYGYIFPSRRCHHKKQCFASERNYITRRKDARNFLSNSTIIEGCPASFEIQHRYGSGDAHVDDDHSYADSDPGMVLEFDLDISMNDTVSVSPVQFDLIGEGNSRRRHSGGS